MFSRFGLASARSNSRPFYRVSCGYQWREGCAKQRAANRADLLRTGWDWRRGKGGNAEVDTHRRAWSRGEMRDILEYCQSDVDALRRLLPAMLPRIDLPRALYRGRSMAAVASIERNGTPVNTGRFYLLRENWEPIQSRLITSINPDYQVFDGRKFKRSWFERWLVHNNYPWPRLESGQLALDDDTFHERSKALPAVAPLRELRHALSEMRLNKLAVGSKGSSRNAVPFP